MLFRSFTKALSHREGLKWWYGTLWVYYDKLDTAVRGEVERTARDMASGDGIVDLNLYLQHIGQELGRRRQELTSLPHTDELASYAMELGARLSELEGNYHRLNRIVDGK